ncbi:glycerophosphodiester phosphodiesterase GDPD4-like isoform X2 [Phragmites australis]|uniref:glycerophosphodiester phosphodiesterase GDPD4-like isoform X2 n=1 Tax=Phragmites australis TaxID=29695 RepID=UPI002D791FFF|nr:glycerophosphodiester phosphodiesterase GDPD4-like isoform X2 [Phragmites australis]
MRGFLGLRSHRRQPPPLPLFPTAKRPSQPAASLLLAPLSRLLPASRLLRLLLLLAVLSLAPPAFFHLRLRRFYRMRERKCGWIASPPMVCAHGGESTNAFPNSMDAFHMALDSRVDCVEIDISRSFDGVLLALHDRDLQRMSGNSTAKVGYWSKDEIKALSTRFQLSKRVQNEEIPKAEDALAMISQLVRQVILDVKVGPPSFEKDLAEDVLSLISRTNCKNCLVWAKSDNLGRDIIKLSKDVAVGYIVMVDKSTGRRTELVRIEGAKVAGVYHPLIDEKVMKDIHSFLALKTDMIEESLHGLLTIATP